MFEFEKHYKNYEQAVERVVQTYEFWLQAVLSSTKEFFKAAKSK